MSQGADAAAAEGSVAVHRQGAVLRLTLDRPSRRNALTQLMIATLVDALTAAASDDSLRVVHIVAPGTTSAPAPTGWPSTIRAGPARAPVIWCAASPTPRTG